MGENESFTDDEKTLVAHLVENELQRLNQEYASEEYESELRNVLEKVRGESDE